MNTNFERDVDSGEERESGLKERMLNASPSLAAAAVLALVAAFGQDIKDTSVPQDQEQDMAMVDNDIAQAQTDMPPPPSTKKVDKVNKSGSKEVNATEKEYERIEKRFDDIFAKVRYLDQTPKLIRGGSRGHIYEWKISPVTVDGKKYDLKVGGVGCFNGVKQNGQCEGSWEGHPNGSWRYVILNGKKFKGEYVRSAGKIKLKIYSLKKPKKRGTKLVPNAEAHVKKEVILPDLSRHFVDEMPETVYKKQEYSQLDKNSKGLDDALKKLRAGKVAREKLAEAEAKKGF